MNVNEARIFTTPALHAKSTRKDVLRKLTFHFKPKLKVFNQTKYLIQNINLHIKRILLFLKIISYFICRNLCRLHRVHRSADRHLPLPARRSHDILRSPLPWWCMSIPRTETLYDYWITTCWGTRGLGTIHPWCIAQIWSSLLDVTEQRRNREGCEGTPALSVFAIFSLDKNG